MTQAEFLEKKQDGLKECKAYLTKEFLKEFDIEMAEYLKTYAQDIRVRIPYSLSKKEVLEIIASKYPDLKLRLKICVEYGIYYYFTPKRKFTIFGREVWI
jgi:hypothetical protein